jgi:hypothetical protein
MLHSIALEARKERAWNSPDAQRRRSLAEANDRAAQAMLEAASPDELDAHIEILKADLQMKRAAYHAVTSALAKALNVKLFRSEKS